MKRVPTPLCSWRCSTSSVLHAERILKIRQPTLQGSTHAMSTFRALNGLESRLVRPLEALWVAAQLSWIHYVLRIQGLFHAVHHVQRYTSILAFEILQLAQADAMLS